MFDLNYFNVRRFFGNDKSQDYLMFQPISNTFRIPTTDAETIIACKFKEFSGEKIKPSATPDNKLASKLKYINISKIAIKFKGSCLKRSNICI